MYGGVGAGAGDRPGYPMCAPGTARSAVTRRCQAASESDPRSDLEVQVPWRGWWLPTPSRTATALRQRNVGRKLQAKLRPEEHEAHTRRSTGGREGTHTRSPICHPDRSGVYAPGIWSEGHASYPGRSGRLPRASVVVSRRVWGPEVSRGHSSRGVRDEGPNEVTETRGVLRSALGRSPFGGPDCRK